MCDFCDSFSNLLDNKQLIPSNKKQNDTNSRS